MEKKQKLLDAEELPLRQQDRTSPRRSKHSNLAIVAALLLLFATFRWVTVGPPITISNAKQGCKHKLSVEQRAARILKKHPLIGQHCRTWS